MRICFLSSMHPAKDKRVFEKEAVALAAAGFEVLHLSPGSVEESGEYSGVRIITYPRRKGIRGRLAQLRSLYRRALELDADVYHCNEVDSWFVGILLRLRRGKGCVFDVHEHYPSTFAESRFPKAVRPVVAGGIRFLFRCLTPLTDAVVAAKRSVVGDFKSAGRKIVLVQNYTPLAGVRWASECRSGDTRRPLTLVHLGLFSKVRGWPQTIEALTLMQDKTVRLEIVGEINDGTRDELVRRIVECGLQERVTLREWMPFRQAFELLCRADVGLVVFQPGILNHVYALPHKMFDYMAAGMAVVCPEFAEEIAPIVRESGCGVLVDPANARQLAAALDALALAPDELRRMGERGQRAIRERYNWEAEADALLNLYRTWESRSS